MLRKLHTIIISSEMRTPIVLEDVCNVKVKDTPICNIAYY